MFERTPNRMLEKIRNGKPAYGMQCYIHDSRLYEVAGWAGMDFCMIDMEPVSYTHLDVYKRQVYGRVKSEEIGAILEKYQ